jgi:hypothetical protein
MYWRSILLTALIYKYEEYENLATSLHRFYYINWIAGNTLTRIKQISFNLIKWIHEGRDMNFIQSQFNDHIRNNKTLDRATDNLNGDIYFEPWCKPLLIMIEYHQTDNSSLAYIDPYDKNIHVEHIIPQTYDHEEWSHLSINDIENWINSGANLTLLSGKKNIQASNNGFAKKIKVYKGKGIYEDKEEGITTFRITQKIADLAESNNNKWAEQQIYDRWEWFCLEIEAILKIDLSTIRKI